MLGALKNPCTFTKLAIKHALLIAIINSNEKCLSLRHLKAFVLGVHHSNMSLIVEHQKLIDFGAIFWFILAIRK